MLTPIVIASLLRKDHPTLFLGGVALSVSIIYGLFLAISRRTSSGGAWDNAKKLIEDGVVW